MTTNTLKVCVIGIGKAGHEAVQHIRGKPKLPLLYELTSDVDCLIIVSALESHAVAELINTVGQFNGNDQLVLVIALKPQFSDIRHFNNINKVRNHCNVIAQDVNFYDDLSSDWATQYRFVTQVIDGLFSPIFQQSLFSVDFAELLLLFKPATLVVANYHVICPSNITSLNTAIQRHGVKVSEAKLFVNVMLPDSHLDSFDAVTAFLLQLDCLDIKVCNSQRPIPDNEIGIFVLATHQEFKMNFNRDTLISLESQAAMLHSFSRRLMRDLSALTDSFEPDSPISKQTYSDADIAKISNLNERLIQIEAYLVNAATKHNELLSARIADADDQIWDYELDVALSYILEASDPVFDPDEDNILTSREFSIKRLDQEWSIGDSEDYRESCRQFPGKLNEVRHCYLFHDLYDHSYGLDNLALTLSECCRVGAIWIDIEVKHQAYLAVDTGNWMYKQTAK